MTAVPADFDQANPHALAAIVNASASCSIVASEDIFDERGTKLWAKNQPISYALQQRLLERRLKQPLEACLRAEDGVSAFVLHEALEAFLSSGSPLAEAVAPWASTIATALKQVPLHPSVQLLLTAARATQPQVFEHAVMGMALAGAMQASANAGQRELRLALLAGLLHDVGEIYIDPQYLNGTHTLDEQGYRHVITHPRVGQKLLATLTDYPAELARAVGEHHERLDGTGYPTRALADALSPLGRLLAVAETTLGVVSATPSVGLVRASLALRMIPGEFDGRWVGFVAEAARRAAPDLPLLDSSEAERLLEDLNLMDSALATAQQKAAALSGRSGLPPLVHQVATRADFLLTRLRVGWNAMGLWSGRSASESPQAHFEWQVAKRELGYRMQAIRRECLWPHAGLSKEDADSVGVLWSGVAA